MSEFTEKKRINPDNAYDDKDIVRRKAALIAGPLKIAAYTVLDPETLEHGDLQFHMTFNNSVMAVMGESAARLFTKFVTDTLGTEPAPKSIYASEDFHGGQDQGYF